MRCAMQKPHPEPTICMIIVKLAPSKYELLSSSHLIKRIIRTMFPSFSVFILLRSPQLCIEYRLGPHLPTKNTYY